MRVREPAVAGYFYPADSRELEEFVATLLDEVVYLYKGNYKAIIAPHAGYVYSGITAAYAFKPLERIKDSVRKVLLIGPAHYVLIRGLAVLDVDYMATPLGLVPVDKELVEYATSMKTVSIDGEPHLREHSLEVELPFLQYVLGDFTVLPVVVGRAVPEEVGMFLEMFYSFQDLIFVVSSDLSHYLTYNSAKDLDEETKEKILSFDIPLEDYRACGARAINGLLWIARKYGFKGECFDLRNSGDTAGDKDRVVGYGAFGFSV